MGVNVLCVLLVQTCDLWFGFCKVLSLLQREALRNTPVLLCLHASQCELCHYCCIDTCYLTQHHDLLLYIYIYIISISVILTGRDMLGGNAEAGQACLSSVVETIRGAGGCMFLCFSRRQNTSNHV